MGCLSERCKKCAFRSHHAGGSCDYIGIMHTRRPCPAGDDCTVFEPGRKRRQKMITVTVGRRKMAARERSCEA